METSLVEFIKVQVGILSAMEAAFLLKHSNLDTWNSAQVAELAYYQGRIAELKNIKEAITHGIITTIEKVQVQS